MDRKFKPVSIIAVDLILLVGMVWLSACSPAEIPPPTQTNDLPQELAQTYIEQGDLPSAVIAWEEYLQTQNPQDAEAHYQLGLLLLILDPDSAKNQLEQAETLDPTLTEQISRLKSALRQAGAVEDKAYHFTIAGQALASINEWSLAEIALEMAVTENPEYAEAWAYLGETRQQTGSPGSLDELQTAHAIKPDGFSVNLFLGIYYRRVGKPMVALPYLEKAAEQDPNSLSLQADLAQTEVETGQVSKAFERLYALVDSSPDDPVRWLMLARLSIENNLQIIQDGLPAARQASVFAPEDPQPIVLIGRAYLLMDQPLLAERFLLQAVELDPDLSEPHYYLGILYLNTNQSSSAENQLQITKTLAQSSGDPVFSILAEKLLEEYFP